MRHAGFLALIVTCCVLPSEAAANSRPRFGVGPVPAWVTPLPPPVVPAQATCESPLDQRRAADAAHLLRDEQERFAPPAHEVYSHQAYVVTRPSDVQSGSELSVRYVPDFERVTLHYAYLYRANRRIDALRSAQIRTLDSEIDRERFLYDAGQNILIVLADVRPGDTIEWAYTRSGANPAIAAHTLGTVLLGQANAVRSRLARVLVPKTTRISYRLHGGATPPLILEAPDSVAYEWRHANVEAFEDDGDTPSWHFPGPWVEFSEFDNWGQVADWARRLYASNDELPAELEELVEDFRRLGDDATRLLAAARFVQEEIRYLGMEIGPHSLVPHPVGETFARRFGDCKDKTLLLVAILKRLGIEAVAALVSSQQGRKLAERLPSPLAFDHVITKVTLGGKTYWFDPTLTHERGDLGAHEFSDFYHALPLAADTRDLESLRAPPDQTQLSEIEEHYELGELTGPIQSTVQTVLRGKRADEFRARLEEQGAKALHREYLNFFAKRFDGTVSVSPPVIVDDETANAVTIRESYQMASLFRDGEVRLTPWSFEELLAPPAIVQRRTPLAVAYPFAAEHRIRLSYRRRPDFQAPKFNATDGVLRFTADSVDSQDGSQTLVTFKLSSLSDAVEPEQLEQHLALRRRIDQKLEFLLAPPQAKPEKSAPSHSVNGSHLLAAALGGLSVLFVGVVIERRRRRRAQPAQSGVSAASSSGSTEGAATD